VVATRSLQVLALAAMGLAACGSITPLRDGGTGSGGMAGTGSGTAGAGGGAAGAGGGAGRGGAGGGGRGGSGGGPDTNCTNDSDCVLYGPMIGDCCGTCQPKSLPQPGPVNCLVACPNPLKTCTCSAGLCTGGTN
jgi:hypothetical protein